MRELPSWAPTAALLLCFRQVAERLGNLLLALVAAMQVDQRSTGRRVTHAIHQFSQRNPGARRKLVAGAGPRNGVGRRVRRG